MMEITAKFEMVGMMRKPAWVVHMGGKVLCDALVRVRRFASEDAAMKAGREARISNFY